MYINEELVRKVREGTHAIKNENAPMKLKEVLLACGVSERNLPLDSYLQEEYLMVQTSDDGIYEWCVVNYLYAVTETEGVIPLSDFFKEPSNTLITEEEIKQCEDVSEALRKGAQKAIDEVMVLGYTSPISNVEQQRRLNEQFAKEIPPKENKWVRLETNGGTSYRSIDTSEIMDVYFYCTDVTESYGTGGSTIVLNPGKDVIVLMDKSGSERMVDETPANIEAIENKLGIKLK